MGFTLGNLIIDRVPYAWAEKFDGTPLFVITQMQEPSISITAESKDATDANGTLVKRFWQGKQGEFTCQNAMLSLPLIAAQSGVTPDIVSDGKLADGTTGTLTMPKIITVDSGKTITLPGIVEGSIHCAVLESNGGMGDVMSAGASSTATTYVLSGESFTAPTISGTQFIIKYNRTVSNGAIIQNSADKFPDTMVLTLKALAVDPCDSDELRACYIELPSFQPSPETDLSLQTDSSQEFNGALQVRYCDKNKPLYRVYWCDETED